MVAVLSHNKVVIPQILETSFVLILNRLSLLITAKYFSRERHREGESSVTNNSTQELDHPNHSHICF